MLITAGASLIVAILSAVTALVNGKLSSKTAQSVELLKHTLALEVSKAELSNNEMIAALDSLRSSMQAIQRVKDEIQLIANATGPSLEPKEALSRVETAVSEVLETYQKKHPYLEQDEASVLHHAKNTAFRIQQVLINALHGKSYVSELDAPIIKTLLELRADLTESQHLLRDLKTDRIIHNSVKVSR